ncbi:hypothetical protein ES703_106593 [subsurface metagenome]
MGAVTLWGWDDTNKVWVKVLVDTDGKLRISDADPFEIIQGTPADLKHSPQTYDPTTPAWRALASNALGHLLVQIASLAELDDIDDVNVAAPTDGYVLYWDATAGKFQLKAVVGTKIIDADADTKVDVEEAADEDKVRMDVGGVEAFYLSDVGILTLAKQSRCKAYRADTRQTITTSTFTKVEFNAETYDNQNEFDSTTNYRFTALEAGYYYIAVSSSFVDALDGKRYHSVIYKNGAAHAYCTCHASHTGSLVVNSTMCCYLDAGDFIEGWVWHNSAVDIDINYSEAETFICVHKLS